MSTYRARSFVPPLVQRALDLAKQQEFKRSCLPEVGRLLSVLASHIQQGRIGEIGTGAGVGAAWMLSQMAPKTRFVTVEADAQRATAAQDLFRDLPNAQVIHGDWREILGYGPFDLLFIDAGPTKAPPGLAPKEVTVANAAELILPALCVGGIAVLDDLTPESCWPEAYHGQQDSLRDFWLNDTRLNVTEVLTTPQTVVILATRIG